MTRTTFEDRLLTELRAVVAARPEPEPAAAATRPVWRAPRARLTFAAGAVAATIVGVFIASGGDTATPAYAVEKQADGSVTVEVHSLSDAAGLQDKLRAAGIPAVVRVTPSGKTCAAGPGHPAPGAHTMGLAVREDHSAAFTIPRGELRPGETLVIMSSGATDSGVSSLGTAIVDGPVPACTLVDAPGVRAPGSGGGEGGKTFRTGGPTAGATSVGPSTHGAGPSTHTGP